MRQSKYWHAGITVFCTAAAILFFYDTLFGSKAAIAFCTKLYQSIKPIVYGAMIAYMLAPVVDFLDHVLFAARTERAKAAGRYCAGGGRAVSLLITWVLISFLIYLLLSVLLPEVYRSVMQLIGNLENYYNTINTWIMGLLEQSPTFETFVMEKLNAYYEDLSTLLTEQVLPQAQQLMSVLSGGVVSLVVLLKNLLIGIIVSVYLLSTKERCASYSRKLVCGLFDARYSKWIFRAVGRADRIFSGFVRGKLLDSLIIGLICFICSSIFQFPYTPLVSLIIGVTNIIPFFGPFLGAIPCLFLILLDDPIKALYFLIFIIALQQVDGNIIGPKILGDRTGLSSLWVIIAILVGGSFFGIPGMFFGVPVFACLNTAIEFFTNSRLKKQGMPQDMLAYRDGAPRPPAKPEQ